MNVDVVYNKSCQKMDELPDESIDMCLSSPPYFGLRDYGEDVREVWGGDPDCEHQWNFEQVIHDNLRFRGASSSVGNEKNKEIHRGNITNSGFCLKCGAWYGQLGLEPTFQLYLDHMMIVCAEIKRVLKKTGSFWLNMGDTYGGSCSGHGDTGLVQNFRRMTKGYLYDTEKPQRKIMPKCLLGIPSRLRNRLIDEQGWTCRNTVIWAKPNSMPSSKKDGLTPSYEFLFHFVKNIKPQYYWNEKTGLMADRKPPKARQKEGIDWDYQTVGVVNENIFNVRVRDGDTERFLEGATEEEKKNYGKLKERTHWHSLGYWYDLDAIREPHAQTSIARLFRGVDPGNKYDYANNPVEHSARNLSKPRLNIRKITRGPKEIPFQEQSIRPSGGDHHLMSNMLTSLQKSVLAGRGKNPGDVWVIPSQPRPEAHFATFPDKLTIKPILATCPAEVCKKCGKARVRITKPTNEYKKLLGTWTQDTDISKKLRAKIGFQAHSKKVATTAEYQTIGWTDCGCNAGWKSGVLLDPFAGRGTALIMAKKLGRHYVGYELKKKYCEKLIKPALEEIDPLFNYKKPSGVAFAL